VPLDARCHSSWVLAASYGHRSVNEAWWERIAAGRGLAGSSSPIVSESCHTRDRRRLAVAEA